MANAFQSNAFQETAGHVAFQQGGAGGGGVNAGSSISGGVFSKKRWHALINAMAAERAAREQAEFMKPENRRARALKEAADAASWAIKQIRLEAEEREEYEEHDASLVRLTELLTAATGAKRTTHAIKNAERLLDYAKSLRDCDDEEEAITLLLLSQ